MTSTNIIVFLYLQRGLCSPHMKCNYIIIALFITRITILCYFENAAGSSRMEESSRITITSLTHPLYNIPPGRDTLSTRDCPHSPWLRLPLRCSSVPGCTFAKGNLVRLWTVFRVAGQLILPLPKWLDFEFPFSPAKPSLSNLSALYKDWDDYCLLCLEVMSCKDEDQCCLQCFFRDYWGGGGITGGIILTCHRLYWQQSRTDRCCLTAFIFCNVTCIVYIQKHTALFHD